MDDLTKEFKQETQELVAQLTVLLEEAEEDPTRLDLLEQYGQIVDRIMGGAKSMVFMGDGNSEIDKIGAYAELCKLIGYKSSQVANNKQLTEISIAFLFDATEMMEKFLEKISDSSELNLKDELSDTFLSRLAWLESQFDESLRGSLKINNKKLATPDKISDLLKAMGV